MPGLFITLEGGDGAGKSTLLQGLCAWLQDEQGIEPVVTREPGGTALGEGVRQLVLDPAAGDVTAEAELLLYFAARAQLAHEVIRPALAAGRAVICDRFVDASFAYQGGGRGQPAERIATLAEWTVGGLKPDLTLLLDIPPDVGRQRIATRGETDRIEREQAAFFERVRASYRARAAAEPQRFCVLDAAQPAAEVRAVACAAVAAVIERVAS